MVFVDFLNFRRVTKAKWVTGFFQTGGFRKSILRRLKASWPLPNRRDVPFFRFGCVLPIKTTDKRDGCVLDYVSEIRVKTR